MNYTFLQGFIFNFQFSIFNVQSFFKMRLTNRDNFYYLTFFAGIQIWQLQ